MIVLILFGIVGYATTLLSDLREVFIFNVTHKPKDATLYQTYVDNIDNLTYWIFMTGCYKDKRPDVAKYFWLTIALLMLGLFIEKKAINWLTNRWGCTYNKL